MSKFWKNPAFIASASMSCSRSKCQLHSQMAAEVVQEDAIRGRKGQQALKEEDAPEQDQQEEPSGSDNNDEIREPCCKMLLKTIRDATALPPLR
ncbi:hypothetical protein MBANPS3_007989 [Mucor bainieri]